MGTDRSREKGRAESGDPTVQSWHIGTACEGPSVGLHSAGGGEPV